MPTGADWEHEVADYLRSRNYRAEVRYLAGSHEIDVYATKAGETLVVECKDWGQAVSKDPVRTVHNNANEVGVTPGLAYTSDLTNGAAKLAEDYDVLLFPADIVRGERETLEDVEAAARSHTICLPDVSDLSRLDDLLGPFAPGPDFPAEVAEEVRRQSFGMGRQAADTLQREIEAAVDGAGASKCIPVLRTDSGRLDLYFVGEEDHDALPRPIGQESLPVG